MDLLAKLDASAQTIRAFVPELQPGAFIGLVLGSGLGEVVEELEDRRDLPYSRITRFPQPTVHGHEGRLCVGTLGGVPVVALQGRVHLYEGHEADGVVHGVRTLVRLGARVVLLTNAAGGIRPGMKVGDFMVLSDHINLTGATPLLGPNDDRLGPRFPDCTRAWDPVIRDALLAAAGRSGLATHQGVYAGLLGPSYETPAEVRMLRTLGADAVGMSTVLEAIAIRHMGGRLGGLSLITNAAAGSEGTDQVLDHADVAHVARAAARRLGTLLRAWFAARDGWWN